MRAEAKRPTTAHHEIVETHDCSRVHHAFMSMSPEALVFLWNHLEVDDRSDRDELPEPTTATGRQFLLHELHRSAAQEGGCFFIVIEQTIDGFFEVFVSPDITGAQSYSQKRLNERT